MNPSSLRTLGRWLTCFLIPICSTLSSASFQTLPDMQALRWVDSVYQSMTEAQRLGQCFMLRAHSNLGPDHEAQIRTWIQKYEVGGLCFFQGNILRQAALTNAYQQLSRIPLLISMDAEWGLGMRLKQDGIAYPHAMAMGGVQNTQLLYEQGLEIGRQCRALGVHLNFAPDADVNNNPRNPVINFRSFGEDPQHVAECSESWMRGLRDAGVLACAKHFPGHGDTEADSHFDKPVIWHNSSRMEQIEYVPFRKLVSTGTDAIMCAHVYTPGLYPSSLLPSSLSKTFIQEQVRKQLNFQGLVITDAMEMEGARLNHSNTPPEALALEAGNDIILLPNRFDTVFAWIRDSFLIQKKIDLATPVKRILLAKYRAGLTKTPVIDTNLLVQRINTPEASLLKEHCVEAALLLVRDQSKLLPLTPPTKNQQRALLQIGTEVDNPFRTMLERYTGPMQCFTLSPTPDSLSVFQLYTTLKKYDAVIFSWHGMKNAVASNFGFSPRVLDLLWKLNLSTKLVGCLFGNPYSLKNFESIPTLAVGYQDEPIYQELMAQALCGARSFTAKTSVTATPSVPLGTGMLTDEKGALRYGQPESVGMSSEKLEEIDPIVQTMIQSRILPGCQILVARKGTVVYYKSFGYHTYDSLQAVRRTDLYDLASLTKVTATTLAIMRLYEQGLIDIEAPLSNYLPELIKTNKRNLRIQDIMLHRAGLEAWIPFYKNTLTKKGIPDPKWYSPVPTSHHRIQVADQMYVHEDVIDQVWEAIVKSPIHPRQGMKYSDLGFYLLAKAITKITGMSLNDYMQREFYTPLGMHFTGYHPLRSNPLSTIVPTEEDNYWRHQRVQGYVHDMGAAILGGEAGNAGVFSNANDLAKLFQMLLQGGHFEGTRYFNEETVRLFTSRGPNCQRRGLGFDVYDLGNGETKNVCAQAGKRTFGHMGFTGTCAWVDPDQELVYIFLSNRTYPNANNNALNAGQWRQKIQEILYQAIKE